MRTSDQIVAHLFDGRTIVAPYVLAGHYSALDPRAHTMINELVAWGSDLVRHPYNNQPMAHIIGTDQRNYAVALDRIAHLDDCPDCADIWDRYTELATQLAPDELLSAPIALTYDEDEPTIYLVVDEIDLDPATNPHAPR